MPVAAYGQGVMYRKDVFQALNLSLPPAADWTWDAYASRGDTVITAENFRMPSWQRYNDVVNFANFGKGRVTRTDGGSGYALVCTTGLPVFTAFTPSQDCLDGIDTRLINRSHLTQEILEANLQGGLIDLPAGQARFALGLSAAMSSRE